MLTGSIVTGIIGVSVDDDVSFVNGDDVVDDDDDDKVSKKENILKVFFTSDVHCKEH